MIDTLFRGDNRRIARELITITNDLREYWPLTVRQLYYQAVSKLVFSNQHSNYATTSKILTKLRRNNILPWVAFEDRSRRTIDKRGISNMQDFALDQLESFLNPRYYQRCLVQQQENYVEVAVEKDALSSIFEDAVWPYCARLNIVRGQVSASLVNQMAERFARAYNQAQNPVLMYFGDLDPTGITIPEAVQRNFKEHHGIWVDVQRVALNPGQVTDYGLPVSLDAAKSSDPNYKKWLAEYGDQTPTELDAMHPRDLTALIQSSIESVLDMESYKDEMEVEAKERQKLKIIRQDVHNFLTTNHPDVFGGHYGY